MLLAVVLSAPELGAAGLIDPGLPLLNVNFAAHLSPGLNATKVGPAAVGQTASDFWNYYSRDIAAGVWKTDGALPNLSLANGTATTAGLIVSNAPGCWGNGSSDAMYNTYIYPFNNGNVIITLTNLPAGQYDFYVYSYDGNLQLTAGGQDYGVRITGESPVANPPVWQDGRQFALYTNVVVSGGQPVTVVVRRGVFGYSVISGMQIVRTDGTPPRLIARRLQAT